MDNEKLETHIIYYFPGSFFSEHENEIVENRNIPKVLPKNCYAFSFYDVVSCEIELDGEKQKVYGKQKNISPTYFIGKTYHVKDIENNEQNRTLISNLKNNSKGMGVKCHTGNWQGLKEDDIVLDPKNLNFAKK